MSAQELSALWTLAVVAFLVGTLTYLALRDR